MEGLRKRSEIPKEDCWDITKIIKDDEEYQSLISLVKEENKKVVALKGHILDSEKTLEDYLRANEKEERAYVKLLLYTRFWYDEDTRNNEAKKRMLEVENLGNLLSESESFVTSEFMEKDLDDALKLLKDETYALYLKRLYKNKKRILSQKEEEIITSALNAFGTPDEAFTSLDVSDARFDSIKIDGKKVFLSHYNYGELLENEKDDVRKKAFKTYYKYYDEHKNTFASLLKGNYQELEFLRKIRKYDSSLEMALDAIDVDKKVYDNLIYYVHAYNELNVTYQKLKAKKLHLKEYHLYDTYVPIVKSRNKKYTKEEAIALTNEALKPLGQDYLEHFNAMFLRHDVDFYPNEGKHNGAYQWGSYDTDSYVLLNFNGTFDAVSTLAHELGHATHSMYSKENNPYPYASYEIFLAEIASTVNETLLSFYMLEHAKDKQEKIYYLCEFLDKVKATIYRQTMFAEFEQIMSEKCQNKESLTEENFSETYYDLNKKYFQDAVIVDKEIRFEWMRISHFYSPFYVYQYATGLISAISIVSDIYKYKDDFVPKYLNFLKSGSSKNVLDILKEVDVDLTTEEPYKKAFQFIENKLEELKILLESGE